MTLQQLIESLRQDTFEVSAPAFGPELALCAAIVLLLLARMVPSKAPAWVRRFNAVWIALPGVLFALYLASPWRHLTGAADNESLRQELFTGMLVYDELSVYFRSLLLVFAALFFVFTWLSGIPGRDESPDFYTLALGGTLGMLIMCSANHMLTIFLGVEMASVPSYALAGFLKGRRQSSEAALKYSVYGAGAAGVMLYGISLLAGALGSVHLPTMATQLAKVMASPDLLADRQTSLVLGGVFLMVGLAFKLSAVPFHFWCPDVFEGASAEVNAYLSVASKAAALALLVRVAIGFADFSEPPSPGSENGVLATAVSTDSRAAADRWEAPPGHAQTRRLIVGLIGFLGAITATFGNLAAYAQANIKRLLAYSTIAHAGIMMFPVAAAVQLLEVDRTLAQQAIAALAYYVGVYLFMNLAAFAFVAFMRNATRSEEISSYSGLIYRSPWIVVCFSIVLLSLLGLPPFSGFFAKLYVFSALVSAKVWHMYALFAIGGLNTVLGLFYYLRVVKTMTLDPEPADRAPVSFSVISPAWIYLTLLTIPVVALGILVDPMNEICRAAVAHLLK